jgi:Na+-driven multidrug efflux pump
VLRGAGKQTVGAALNLFAFYCVGLPISLVLGFASPLAFFGIWYAATPPRALYLYLPRLWRLRIHLGRVPLAMHGRGW